MRPYVLLSAAMSADGYLDDASPRRLVLSGPEDLDRVDELRAGWTRSWWAPAPSARMIPGCSSGRRRGGSGGCARGSRPTRSRSPSPAAAGLDPQARFFAADGTDKLVYAAGPAAGPLRALLAGAAVIELAAGAGLAESSAIWPPAASAG